MDPARGSRPPAKPNPVRHLSEFAVADTPASVVHEYPGGDYLSARRGGEAAAGAHHSHHHERHHHPAGRPRAQGLRREREPFLGDEPAVRSAHEDGDENVGGEGVESGGGMPAALGRGVRGGAPTNERERRGTRYVTGERRGVEKQDENVDADEQMAVYAEGAVADAVERKRGTQKQQQQQQQQQQPDAEAEAAGRGGLVEGGLPEGRLETGEGGLERKKREQAAARRQVVEARERGEDVDGRGSMGPRGRLPRAEV